MALYFDYKVQNSDPTAININVAWHTEESLLAVASYSRERGGYVSLYDELGELVPDIDYPHHSIAQVTALAWHPMKKVLLTGWENGELRVWAGDRDFVGVHAPHQAPITILEWSEQGGRLVSTDGSGSLVCWEVDQRCKFKAIFHLMLKEGLATVVFRQIQPAAGFDISGLAKAAVNGDEQALDMFSAWRPRTAHRSLFPPPKKDNFSFYVGAATGAVFYVSDDGTCTEVLKAGSYSSLKKLLYRRNQDQVLLLTENLSIEQYQAQQNGALKEITKVKVNGRPQESSMSWAGPNTLAIISGDLTIRCWDLETGDNILLEANIPEQMSKMKMKNGPTEIFTCVAYSRTKNLLCGGTNVGSLIMWRWCSGVGDTWSWVHQAPCLLRGAIKQATWGSNIGLLAVNTINSVFIMKEQSPVACYNQSVSAVQVSPRRLVIETETQTLDLTTDQQVTGIAVSSDHVAAWSTKMMVVYQMMTESGGLQAKSTAMVVGSFACVVESASIHEQSIVVLEDSGINIRTFQGTVKQTLALTSGEGQPMLCNICGQFLLVVTTTGILKVWDLSRREAKLHCPPKDLDSTLHDFTEVITAKINCNGTAVSFSVANVDYIPSSKLYLWNIEADTLSYFDVETGKLDTDNSSDTSVTGDDLAISERFILSHFWDSEEPRVLACEAKLIPKITKTESARYDRAFLSNTKRSTGLTSTTTSSSRFDYDKNAQVIVIGMFTSPEKAFIIQDVFAETHNQAGLLGVRTPHYLLVEKPSEKNARTFGDRVGTDSSLSLINKKTMRDFDGLEDCDATTRKAVLDFSFSMSIGNMDEAFKSIRTVQSPAVWESLAKMCVKTQRLDVARVCLGHMGHARGALALRLAEGEPELEARVGMLALQLGMSEEAERLYISCGRYDLLNRVYQARGDWDSAIKVATDHDRIHLRTTYNAYAHHLMKDMTFEEAISNYKKAGTYEIQMPRIIKANPVIFQAYLQKNRQPDVISWWGQYMESLGNKQEARELYEEAGDKVSLVRLLCSLDELDQAAAICTASSDKACSYQLAYHYERAGMIKEAIVFYTKAQTFDHAVRLCREQGLDEQLWQMSLMATQHQQYETAKYFEAQDQPEKAIELYRRAGYIHLAVELAHRAEQYKVLDIIALNLDSNSDPELIEKCAEYFVKNEQFDKAVELYSIGKQYEKAMSLCEAHNVILTDMLADKLTVPKTDENQNLRINLCKRIAQIALAQNNYHLATKKFTQAGDKESAMKALLKSGDTEKIIFFATVSRQKEIYIMAANYLQTLDWQTQPEMLKNIITFYTKGKAPELLANFYVTCSQVEVDEFQNYEKALGALEEALRCLTKESGRKNMTPQIAVAVETLGTRISFVKRFLEVKRLWARGEEESAFSHCRQLLQAGGNKLDDAVRRGDIYALMVQHRVNKQDYKLAHQLIEEFKAAEPGVNLSFYLSTSVIENVYKGVGLPLEKEQSLVVHSDMGLIEDLTVE